MIGSLLALLATGALASASQSEFLRCNAAFTMIGVLRSNGAVLPSDIPATVGGDNLALWAKVYQADPELDALEPRARREAAYAMVSKANGDYIDANLATPNVAIADYRRCLTKGLKPGASNGGRYINRAAEDW